MKQYTYIFKSPLSGSISCDELFSDTEGVAHLDSEEMAHVYNYDPRLASFLENNQEDLTEYMHDELKSYVRKLEVGNHALLGGALYLLSYVCTDSKMTDEQAQQVMRYITGQFSDGWGEGLEQREWREDKVAIGHPVFNAVEGEWDEDTTYAYAYFNVHPWSPDQFFIELHECVEEEVDDPKPIVHSSNCRLLPDGGYAVRTVYQLNSEKDVLSCIKNSGLLYSDEFCQWLADFGTFGRDIKLYIVAVNEGLFNKFLPVLGVHYLNTDNCRLFSIDAESGELNLDEYTEEEQEQFFKDIIAK